MTRVVVVDDDEQSAKLAARVLASMGLESVATAGSAEEFVGLVADAPADLVLLDIRLGGDDGLALARSVVAQGSTAVIMVSGLDSPSVLQQAIALGAYGYVVKPYRSSELEISVLNALRRQQLEREAAAHRDDLERAVELRTHELQEALTEVTRVNRVREEMLANFSHELKTPLTPILGWSSYLERRADLGSEVVQRCAAVITEQAARLLRVVDSLLAARAVATGTVDLAPVTCDVAAVAREVAATHPRCSPRVPADEVLVGMGPREVGMVLEQLLDNAQRFAPESPVLLEVSQVGTMVRLVVQDHGPGLPRHLDTSELIEPFVQGDGSSTRAVGGLGIGLYVVAGVVRARGGSLSLQETQGGGLTAVAELPWAGRSNGRRGTD